MYKKGMNNTMGSLYDTNARISNMERIARERIEVNPVQTRVNIVANVFDFEPLLIAIENVIEYDISRNRELLSLGLSDMQAELNKFFSDSQCMEVIYTENTDKMFFGMTVMPYIESKKIYDYVDGSNKMRIDKYYLELDSKLFGAWLNLTSREILACLLHEIGHIVNDSSGIHKLRMNIMNYSCSHGPLRTTENSNYREILSFGIKDSLRKIDSIFDKKNDELIADEFVVSYGFGDDLENALDKIVKASGYSNKDLMTDKLMVMSWTLRLYNDIKTKRIPALYLIRKMIDIVPSYYEKKELQNLEVHLRRIDDDDMLGNYIQEGAIIRRLGHSSVKQYESDLYEMTMQVRNIQREDDALIIMRRINSHISVLEDIIQDEQQRGNEANTHYIKQCDSLLTKYIKLREMLASKTVYKDDYNRIYISYPPIQSNRY